MYIIIFCLCFCSCFLKIELPSFFQDPQDPYAKNLFGPQEISYFHTMGNLIVPWLAGCGVGKRWRWLDFQKAGGNNYSVWLVLVDKVDIPHTTIYLYRC